MRAFAATTMALTLAAMAATIEAQAPQEGGGRGGGRGGGQAAAAAPSGPPAWVMPSDEQRCPSKWGANDQRGSGNWMKPEIALRAARAIKTGEKFELGELLSMDTRETFLNGGRHMEIYTKPSQPTPGRRTENE